MDRCNKVHKPDSQKVAAEKPSNDNATAKIDTLGYISDSPDIVLIYAYV